MKIKEIGIVIERIVERIDIYLLLLVAATAYMLVFSDSRYFNRENKTKARNQSLIVGIVMFVITIGLYVVRQTWL